MSKIFVDQVDPKTATTLTLGTTGDTVEHTYGCDVSGAGTGYGRQSQPMASGTGGDLTGNFAILEI